MLYYWGGSYCVWCIINKRLEDVAISGVIELDEKSNVVSAPVQRIISKCGR